LPEEERDSDRVAILESHDRDGHGDGGEDGQEQHGHLSGLLGYPARPQLLIQESGQHLARPPLRRAADSSDIRPCKGDDREHNERDDKIDALGYAGRSPIAATGGANALTASTTASWAK
jgi:hypothetical protein